MSARQSRHPAASIHQPLRAVAPRSGGPQPSEAAGKVGSLLTATHSRVWTEKMLTLTLTHSGDVRRDIATLPRAWRIFWKLTRLHLELDRGLSKTHVSQLVYLRVIEITAGQKSDGHAHMHVYLICPYLYSPILRLLWAKAIEACGYDLNARSAPTPLADVLAQVVEDWRRAELQRLRS